MYDIFKGAFTTTFNKHDVLQSISYYVCIFPKFLIILKCFAFEKYQVNVDISFFKSIANLIMVTLNNKLFYHNCGKYIIFK